MSAGVLKYCLQFGHSHLPSGTTFSGSSKHDMWVPRSQKSHRIIGDEGLYLSKVQLEHVRGSEGGRTELHRAIDDPFDAALEERAVLHGDGIRQTGQRQEQDEEGPHAYQTARTTQGCQS